MLSCFRKGMSESEAITLPDSLCRYTAFVILYPMGASGEMMCYFSSLDRVKSTGLHSMKMPNSFNMSFNFHYLLVTIMILYVFLFPVMYSHMFAQRKKFFAKNAEKNKSS